MALGFSSRYQPDNTATFGSLTQNSVNTDNESHNSSDLPSLIVGHTSSLNNVEYDNCEFSTSVDIDYSQYSAVVADGSCSETAGSVAFGDCGGGASFSGGDCGGGASFSGGGGGMSCASFTC